jgi:hypothetical protein
MLEAIAMQKGDILVQSVEGSNTVIPYHYFMVDRVNDYTVTVSPVSIGVNRGDRHIRLTDPFKLRLNLKTLIYEYKDDTNLCSFKKFDLNDHYSSHEGINTEQAIFGTSPIAHSNHIMMT